jgi:hypothetical protein
MATGLRSLASVLIFMSVVMTSLNAAADWQLQGLYRAQGVDAEGAPYSALVQIIKFGDSHLVRWTFVRELTEMPDEPDRIGVGIARGDVLAVSYFSEDFAVPDRKRWSPARRAMDRRWRRWCPPSGDLDAAGAAPVAVRRSAGALQKRRRARARLPPLESARLLDESNAIDDGLRRVDHGRGRRETQAVRKSERFAGDKRQQSGHEQLQRVLRLLATELLVDTPGHDRAPIGQVLPLVDLKAHRWIRAHGPDLEALCAVGVDRFTVEHVSDRYDVRAPVTMAADPPDDFVEEHGVDLFCRQFAEHGTHQSPGQHRSEELDAAERLLECFSNLRSERPWGVVRSQGAGISGCPSRPAR